MTLQDGINKALAYIDQYSNQGTVVDPNDPTQKDYILKMPFFFDTAQKQVAQVKRIIKTFKISHNKPINQLQGNTYQSNIYRNNTYQFDIVQHVQATDLIYSAAGSLAYYFEVDDVATVYIEECTDPVNLVWTPLTTISNTLTPGQFTAYSGFITAQNSADNIRIRFSGAYTYNARNIALYNNAFSDITRIPAYQRYVLYTMPTDFYMLNKVVLKGETKNDQSYMDTNDYYWEQRNVIAISWFDVGEYTVEYAAFPADLTISTPTTYALENTADAQECYPFFVASQLLSSQSGKINISNTLFAIFQNMLANLDNKIANAPNMVKNTFFSNSVPKLFF